MEDKWLEHMDDNLELTEEMLDLVEESNERIANMSQEQLIIELEAQMHWRKGVTVIGKLAEMFVEIKSKVFEKHGVADWRELSEKIEYKPSPPFDRDID